MGHVVRILIITFAVWLVVQLIRRAIQRRRYPQPPASPATASRMLPCAYCGVHVLEHRAVVRGDKAYCQDHAQCADGA